MPARELAALLARTVDTELPHLAAIPDGDATRAPNRPHGGGWSRREELGHLIDSAVNNHARFVRAATQPTYEGPGYDQDAWIEAHRYRDTPWHDLVDAWRAHNLVLVPLVAHLTAEKLATVCTVGSYAPMPLSLLIEDYVLHMQHHLDQVLRRAHVTKYPR